MTSPKSSPRGIHASLSRERGPREKSLQGAILDALNRLPHCRALNQHGSPYTRRGEPDIRGCYRGRAFFLEVKRPGKPLTKLQEIALQKWAEAGAIAARVESVGEALEIVQGAEALLLDLGASS